MEIKGYTTGVFDLFHIGHLNLLKRARASCNHLVVGLTTDELSLSRKGKAPIIPYQERFEILSSIKFVDEVVSQDSMDKMQAWERYQFDSMFVGDDWKGSPSWQEWEIRFAAKGVDIVYLPYTKHTSSTLLRRAIEVLAEPVT